MILALARDTVRVLMRRRSALLLVAVGLLSGLFVRATRAVGTRSLHGAELEGAGIETLVSALFLVVVIHGLVSGLILGVEDRGSGFFAHLAVRPVRRLTYAAGRLLGIVAAMLCSVVVLAITIAAPSGLALADVPPLRERIVAARVVVDGNDLGEQQVAHVVEGSPARFEFGADSIPTASLRLVPKIPLGAEFSGHLEIAVTFEGPDGETDRFAPVPFRPLRELPIHFERPGGRPFALVVEPASRAFVLEVDRSSLTTLGPRASVAGQLGFALGLVILAGTIAASIAFFLSVGLSPGTASLAGSFILLVALGRDAVLDVIAGIGQDEPGPGPGEGPTRGRWLRSFLSLLVRLVPDLARFNPAERLGRGDALPFGDLGVAFGVGLLVLGASLVLTAAAVPLRER